MTFRHRRRQPELEAVVTNPSSEDRVLDDLRGGQGNPHRLLTPAPLLVLMKLGGRGNLQAPPCET